MKRIVILAGIILILSSITYAQSNLKPYSGSYIAYQKIYMSIASPSDYNKAPKKTGVKIEIVLDAELKTIEVKTPRPDKYKIRGNPRMMRETAQNGQDQLVFQMKGVDQNNKKCEIGFSVFTEFDMYRLMIHYPDEQMNMYELVTPMQYELNKDQLKTLSP